MYVEGMSWPEITRPYPLLILLRTIICTLQIYNRSQGQYLMLFNSITVKKRVVFLLIGRSLFYVVNTIKLHVEHKIFGTRHVYS